MDENKNFNESMPKYYGFTKVHVNKFSYEWKIYNFSVCAKDVGEILASPQFLSSDNENIKWRLSLFPNGKSSDYKDYLTIYLRLESLQGLLKIGTNFAFSILNKNGIKCFKANCTYTFKQLGGYGYTQFIKRCDIMNDTYLPNDCLTIVCDITAGLSNVTLQSYVMSDRIINQKAELELLYNYESFLNNQQLCDVKIIISEKQLYAHKVILAAQSPVFLAMFDKNMKENYQNQIEIIDIEFNVFQELLRFIYSGKIENMDTVVNDLLVAADKYLIKGLLMKCEQYLQSNLNLENIVNVLTLADNHNAANLRRSAINFFIAHRKEIADANDFQFLETLKPCTVKEIAKSLAMQ